MMLLKKNSRRIVIVLLCSLVVLTSLSAGIQNAQANGNVPPLVETQWLADNLNDKSVRIVHIGSMNPQSQNMFNAKHIPGSQFVSIAELMGAMGNGTNPPDKTRSEALMGRLGIESTTHVVIVGSSNNPFTAAGLWLMKYNGHKTVSYLNGGIGKWVRENRPMTGNASSVKPTTYISNPDPSIFAKADQVLNGINKPVVKIVDVRSAGEFSGKDNPTQAKRTGHIPGAVNLDFYPTNLNQDGTFKSIDELRAIYEKNGVTKDKEILVYCAGGIRASVTQFVLKDILGYPNVKNYVGSWGEWGGRLDPAKYPAEK